MSEPGVFVLIRGGEKSYYADRWAAVFLFREILWGPDEFEKWVTQLERLDEWTDDVDAGAVVDFDQRRLVWSGDNEKLRIPKVASLYDKLLRTTWPKYEIQQVAGPGELAKAAGFRDSEDGESDLRSQYESVRVAAGYSEEDDPDEDERIDIEDDPGAWVTVLDPSGAVRHRRLLEIPSDLLQAADGVIDELIGLDAAEVPPESMVTEGIWIDQRKREIGLWGDRRTRDALREVQNSWKGWSVRWAENGYTDQCQVSGPCGSPLTDSEALAQFMPILLSTKRVDLGNIMGVVGGQLKRTAMKATGCLLGVICFPVILFGLISGNWQAALITIGVVVVLAIVIFKIVELRFRKSFVGNVDFVRNLAKERGGGEAKSPVSVAGPLDKAERRRRIEQLLQQAGLPPLKEIEPKIAKDETLELLE